MNKIKVYSLFSFLVLCFVIQSFGMRSKIFRKNIHNEDGESYRIISTRCSLFVGMFDDGTTRFWDANSGKYLGVFFKQETDIRQRPIVAYDSVGDRFACAKGSNIEIYDFHTRQLLQLFEGYESRNVSSLLFGPKGNFLASLAREKRCLRQGRDVNISEVTLWDLQKGEKILQYSKQDSVSIIYMALGRQLKFAFDQDGEFFVCFDVSLGLCNKWDVQTGELLEEEVYTYNGEISRFLGIMFDDCGDLIGFFDQDQDIIIWNFSKNRLKKRLDRFLEIKNLFWYKFLFNSYENIIAFLPTLAFSDDFSEKSLSPVSNAGECKILKPYGYHRCSSSIILEGSLDGVVAGFIPDFSGLSARESEIGDEQENVRLQHICAKLSVLDTKLMSLNGTLKMPRAFLLQ